MNVVDKYRAQSEPGQPLISPVQTDNEMVSLRRELAIEKLRNQELVIQAKADHEKFSKMAQLSKYLAFRAIEVLRNSQDKEALQRPLIALISQVAHQTKLLAMGLSAKIGSLLPGESGRELLRGVNDIKALAEETNQAIEKLD